MPSKAAAAGEAHDHLDEDGQGHHGEDQPAEQPESLVEAGAPAPERRAAPGSRRAGHAYLMLRM